MNAVDQQIEALYRERQTGLMNVAASIIGDRERARDVVQEAFAIALRDSSRLRKREALAAWVWKIVWRTAQRERGRAAEAALPADLGLLPDDAEVDPELDRAIRSLSPRRRLIVFLRYFADFSYSEIAEALGLSEGTVAAALAQAHQAVRDQLVREVARNDQY